MKRALAAAALTAVIVAALLLANPQRQPMKQCGQCGTPNEPSRTTCINPNCRASI